MPSWNKVGARKSTSETPSDLSESRVLANLAKLALGDLTDTPVPIPPISADAWSVRHPTFLSPTTAQSLLGTHAESSDTGAPNTVPADSTVTLPFNRMGFSISASSHGDLYFFGGATDWNKRFHNDLYRYSTTENTFSSLQCQGDVPSPRSGHVTAIMGKVLLLHGGMTSASNRDDGFFMLNLDSLEWTKIVPAGKAPQARVYHVAAVVGTTFYIFGGSFGNIRYTSANCLWSFDLSTLFTQPTWEIVQPSTPEHPVKRLRHFMVPFYDQLIMFGGQEDLYKYSTLKDTWSFHLKTRVWSKIQSTPDISITSGDQAAASVGSFVYVFGGNCRDLRSNYISAFNMHEQQWTRLENEGRAIYPQEYNAVSVEDKIFLFNRTKKFIHVLDTKLILYSPNNHTTWDRTEKEELEKTLRELRSEVEKQYINGFVSDIARGIMRSGFISGLQNTDAQVVADFLAEVLDSHVLQSNVERRHVLYLLSKLAKTAQVFPKRMELTGVECRLWEPINEGGYGSIYKGTFQSQVVCVKAVKIYANGADPQALRAHAGELVLLANASHPYVLPLYGAFFSNEAKPRICIVSPWMEHGDLMNYLRKFPDAPQTSLVADIAAGVEHLHELDIVHADLKASNILISQSKRALISDFGVSTIANTNMGRTTKGDLAGSFHWMAPELFSRDGTIQPPTRESDMWSFGCICYEVVTCEPPFKNYKPYSLMLAFLRTGCAITPLEPEPDSVHISNVDQGPLMALGEECWKYNPKRRPSASDARQFLASLSIKDDRPPMDAELAKFATAKAGRTKVKVDRAKLFSIIQRQKSMNN